MYYTNVIVIINNKEWKNEINFENVENQLNGRN